MIAKAAEPKALSIYGVHAVQQTADTSMNIKEKPPRACLTEDHSNVIERGTLSGNFAQVFP